MTKIEDLTRRLSMAAANEGKSVTVIIHPSSVDVTQKGTSNYLAVTAMMAALNQPTGFGALNLDHVKVDKEDEPVM